MAKFYAIQIDDIFLTDDGTETGDAVKLAVSDPSALQMQFAGTTIPTCGGAINQLFSISKPVEIRVLTYLSEEVWTALVTLINTALENSDTINIKGVGDIGDFDVNVIPLMPRSFEANEFRNGRIIAPVFRFMTV